MRALGTYWLFSGTKISTILIYELTKQLINEMGVFESHTGVFLVMGVTIRLKFWERVVLTALQLINSELIETTPHYIYVPWYHTSLLCYYHRICRIRKNYYHQSFLILYTERNNIDLLSICFILWSWYYCDIREPSKPWTIIEIWNGNCIIIYPFFFFVSIYLPVTQG